MSTTHTPNSTLEPIRLPRFDWDHTKDFYYVAKLGSLTRAAQFLKTSQPSLSRRMTDLETDLKCKLLHRTPRGVTLTRKGDELFQIVEQNFIALKGFSFDAAAMSDDGQKRHIRLSTTHAIASYVLSSQIVRYNQINPHLNFEIVVDDQLIDVVINDVDVAVRPFDEDAKGVHQEHIFTLEKKLFASADYIKKFGEPQTVSDLENHHMIAHAQPDKHPYSDLNWILRVGMPEGKMRKPVFSSASLEVALEAAKEGLGIVGGYVEMSLIENSGLQIILPDLKGPKIKDYIIYPSYLSKDEEFLKFKSYLISNFRKEDY